MTVTVMAMMMMKIMMMEKRMQTHRNTCKLEGEEEEKQIKSLDSVLCKRPRSVATSYLQSICARSVLSRTSLY
jgi:hypothetical protein